MNMKALRFILPGGLFIAGIMLSGCASITRAKLERRVAFDQVRDAERLPIQAVILLPEEFVRKLPSLAGKDQTIWPWFFQAGLAPAFQQVAVIQRLEELSQHPDAKVVVQPEMWGFFSGGSFDGWGQGEWTYWLDFRYRVRDRNGREIVSIPAEGLARCSDQSGILAACANTMELVGARIQRELKQSMREVILTATGTRQAINN